MKWITRERVKVDRIACPWLIKKFIDPKAEFLFVPVENVMAVAEREKAIPFDVKGIEKKAHRIARLLGSATPERIPFASIPPVFPEDHFLNTDKHRAQGLLSLRTFRYESLIQY